MRKITVFLLIGAMLAALLAVCGKTTVTAPTPREYADDETFHFGNYTYMKYTDGTVAVTGYDGDAAALTVPSVIDGAEVTGIGDGAFSENTSLVSVVLPSGVESVGSFAFINCTSLSSISIGKKLWDVGTSAFTGTPWLAALTDDFVIIGDGVLIKYQGGDSAVTVPDGVKHISDAFQMNDAIVSVDLPDSLLTIGISAFAFCSELRTVRFGNALVSIGNGAFDSCEKLTSLTLPATLESIGSYAFRDCFFISDVYFGSSLKSIGEYAFSGDMRIKAVTLPVSTEFIDSYAFRDCYSLSLVFYEGTKEQFDAIECNSSNYILTEAELYCNHSGG